MNKVYLSSGSNSGNRPENLSFARSLVVERTGRLIDESHTYETESWGYKSGNYYNQCFLIESTMDALSVMEEILRIEKLMGRERNGKKYADRIIDIDMLFFNDEIISHRNLTIPHPRLHERRFVLVPLCEIAPDLIHPVFGTSIRMILEKCEDKLMVKMVE